MLLLELLELLLELELLELLLELAAAAAAADAAAAALLVAVALLLPPLLPPLPLLSLSLPLLADFSLAAFSFSALASAAGAEAFIEYVRLLLLTLKGVSFWLTVGLPALFAVLTMTAPVVSYGIIPVESKCAPRFHPA